MCRRGVNASRGRSRPWGRWLAAVRHITELPVAVDSFPGDDTVVTFPVTNPLSVVDISPVLPVSTGPPAGTPDTVDWFPVGGVLMVDSVCALPVAGLLVVEYCSAAVVFPVVNPLPLIVGVWLAALLPVPKLPAVLFAKPDVVTFVVVVGACVATLFPVAPLPVAVALPGGAAVVAELFPAEVVAALPLPVW